MKRVPAVSTETVGTYYCEQVLVLTEMHVAYRYRTAGSFWLGISLVFADYRSISRGKLPGGLARSSRTRGSI
jgi:hypothetical protein